MTVTTPEAKARRAKSERARQARLKEERRAAGLRRLEIWARPEHHAEIKAVVAKLADKDA